MITGHGVDIVDISRISDACEKGKAAFLKRVYTPGEISAAENKKSAKWAYLAGRWAAKEAFSKALGCGIGEKCSFTDIDVTELPTGAPSIVLSGKALESFKNSGGVKLHISISHEDKYAIASVIIES